MIFKRVFAPRIAFIFYRILSFTWRVQLDIDPSFTSCHNNRLPTVLAHWHGDELAILHLVTPLQLATMTSTSSDGHLIDYIVRKLGGITSRGSSTRGAVQALKGLVRLGKKGHPVSMAVDGPKGPIYQVKSGVFEISRLLAAPIFPVGVHCQKKFLFKKSWNKTYLPYPFAKISICFTEAIGSIGKEQDPRDIFLAKKLEQQLDNAKQQAIKFFATKKSEC